LRPPGLGIRDRMKVLLSPPLFCGIIVGHFT
jgi:hypothetical protein